MIENIKFFAQYQPWSDSIAVYLKKYTEQNKSAYAIAVKWQEAGPGTISAPLFELNQGEAQALMDKLYETGIRPSLAAGSAGQLDAVKYHLEDMRKLVFNE